MMASQPPSARMALVEKLVWAPAPFQSPKTGLGSSVAKTPKSSAMRKRSQRAVQSWSPMSGGGRIADLELPLPHHHLGVGALDGQPGLDAGRGVALDDLAARASCRRRRRSSRGPGGPGSRRPASRGAGRRAGRCTPARCRTTARRRRTSRPTATQAARVLVGCGVRSVSSTSHMTSLSPGPRSGSGQTKTGLRTQSESSPVAWLVLDPSKPQIPGCLPVSTTLVLLRMRGDGSVPSIQMYSAW